VYYPAIDPVIFSVGPVALRWYGLMYVLGFAAVFWLGSMRMRARPGGWTQEQLSDLVFYGALGAVLGGRIGYVLFYNLDVFLDNPLYLIRIWEGGMSFHGGFLGVLGAMVYFCRSTGKSFLAVTDFLAPLCPLGLGFGRLGNFINMELPGRVTESSLGLIYPCDAVRGLNPLCVGTWEGVMRHPSSLYQALSEGLLLFVILWWLSARSQPRGLISGAFLMCYGGFRFMTEFLRSPDPHLGFIVFDFLSMGQLLSLPMIFVGLWLILRARDQVADRSA